MSKDTDETKTRAGGKPPVSERNRGAQSNFEEQKRLLREHARTIFNIRRQAAAEHETGELYNVEETFRFTEQAATTYAKNLGMCDTPDNQTLIDGVIADIINEIMQDTGFFEGTPDVDITAIEVHSEPRPARKAVGPDDETDLFRRFPQKEIPPLVDKAIPFRAPPDNPDSETVRIRNKGRDQRYYQLCGEQGIVPRTVNQASAGEINSLIVGFAISGRQDEARQLIERFKAITSMDEQTVQILGSREEKENRAAQMQRRRLK